MSLKSKSFLERKRDIATGPNMDLTVHFVPVNGCAKHTDSGMMIDYTVYKNWMVMKLCLLFWRKIRGRQLSRTENWGEYSDLIKMN